MTSAENAVPRRCNKEEVAVMQPKPEVGPNYCCIPLYNCGEWAIVDKDIYPYLMQWRWRKDGPGYACRQKRDGEKRVFISMHRVVTHAPANFVVDHINGNPLDNRRENLRLATHAQNLANSKPRKIKNPAQADLCIPGTHYKYKGVYKAMRRGRIQYFALIRAFGVSKHLGWFDRPIDAAKAYDDAAIALKGEFARGNEV